jgi:hypothetical protein
MKYLSLVFVGLAISSAITSSVIGDYISAFWAIQAAFWAFRFALERNRND